MLILQINRLKPDVDMGELGKVIPPHIEWIRTKTAEGFIVQSGKWDKIGGMLMMEADSVEEADKVMQDDPLVASGLISYELGEFFPTEG